ncbi:VOC family protein [Nocardiopsis baichengensis]|uniref:hypothetical protein n=1 Tax=Nocardiopsis baichengensis TaxID=280240 RepID=UPI000344C1B5|nr:hypothetical protein [Nocardiopsis baichengensis]
MTMANIEYITLGAADPAAAERFYKDAFGLEGGQVRVQLSEEPSSGFRGYTLSIGASQPADVDSLLGAAVDAGAEVLKPAAKSFWGYGGVVRAPDGAVWKVASSSKKNTGPVSRRVDDIVLLLGVADVAASKRFYAGQGFPVARSFGRTYAEFDAEGGVFTLALYRRRALAKDLGVDADGGGSHRITVHSGAGAFTDPDGFVWQDAAAPRP